MCADLTKRRAGQEDLITWDGTITETFTALTSTGRTQTLTKVGADDDFDWTMRLGDVITRGPWVDVRAYHASGSATATTGGITTGTFQVTLAAATDFRNKQGVRVVGAGAAGADLVAVINAGGGTTTLTLDTAAGTTVAGASVYHDDTAAIQAAIGTGKVFPAP